jgi:hypothetical protein
MRFSAIFSVSAYSGCLRVKLIFAAGGEGTCSHARIRNQISAATPYFHASEFRRYLAYKSDRPQDWLRGANRAMCVSLERQALRRPLADISQGMIDVVVHKVDRLTRSLADFAKMVEVLAARGVSFVAVTQQFNNTTSMGRLTLNVLLSFAQFEREVTGERIRDKIAASKRKGIWMGGLVPLGYDVIDRRLVVNQTEAETVRAIFRRYLELGAVRLLMEDMNRGGGHDLCPTVRGRR